MSDLTPERLAEFDAYLTVAPMVRMRVVSAHDAHALAAENASLRAKVQRVEALEAAIDRVRRRHPRGDEEPGPLAPGLWCPGCGHERSDNGYGGCPDRAALRDEGGAP